MNWKKIGKKLLFPPVWLMVLLVTACAAALTVVFVRHMEQRIYKVGGDALLHEIGRAHV